MPQGEIYTLSRVPGVDTKKCDLRVRGTNLRVCSARDSGCNFPYDNWRRTTVSSLGPTSGGSVRQAGTEAQPGYDAHDCTLLSALCSLLTSDSMLRKLIHDLKRRATAARGQKGSALYLPHAQLAVIVREITDLADHVSLSSVCKCLWKFYSDTDFFRKLVYPWDTRCTTRLDSIPSHTRRMELLLAEWHVHRLYTEGRIPVSG